LEVICFIGVIALQLLQDRILKDGIIKPGGILKVDGFLNHQIDARLLMDMAEEFKRLYDGNNINKILTIEASGIGLACFTGYVLQCPILFAKKSRTANISDDVYVEDIPSFTHKVTNHVMVSKEYLSEEDRVLIIDDFLATGAALEGLIKLTEKAGGIVVGCGIAVEKVFQGGGNRIREKGYRVESLARISSMTDDGKIEFAENEDR